MTESQEHSEARRAWAAKPALRYVYRDLYARIVSSLAPGNTLEIGSGASHLRDFLDDVVTSDVLAGDGIDIVADAQQLPFPAGAFDNIVMLDVLHHIPRPALFFDEAARVLKNGGRLVVIEPAITPGSYLVYRFFHPEPFDLSADPLRDAPLSSERPYDSNQAIPTLVATRRRQAFQQRYPELAIRDVRWLSFWAYPLTGGLRKWSLLSERMAKLLIRIEDQIPNYLGRWIAFRLMIVFQRQALQVDRTRLQEIV
jgi:SAM-dependent methyltransferase